MSRRSFCIVPCGLEELRGHYKHILLLVYYPRGPILLRDAEPQPPSKKDSAKILWGKGLAHTGLQEPATEKSEKL